MDYVECDVSDGPSIDAAVDEALGRHGRVDVLVNNAGTTWTGPADEEPMEEFRRVIDVNLVGLFHLTQRIGVHMLGRGSGSVVNIASIHGIVSSAPNGQASYCASKGAVINLTRELAVLWARQGVRVNAIAPGYFPSELTEEFLADEKGLSYVARRTPLGRAGVSEELAGALLLLASGAGSYITGQVLAVDGGWTAQ
jgi:NAD(P)-dependent dehydrogenase (short-subunit alcohol dehydrogenase family)